MRTILLFVTAIMSFNFAIAQNNTDKSSSLNALNFAHVLQKSAGQQLLNTNDGIPFDLLTFSTSNDNGFMEEQWRMNMYYKDGKLSSYLKSTTTLNSVSEQTTFQYNDRDQMTNISIYYVLNGGGKGQLKTDFTYNQNGVCTKRQDWQNNFLIHGDSVQIVTNEKKVTSWLKWKYSDGEWIITSMVSNINYNKTGFIRSYVTHSFNPQGAVIKNEFITNLVFFNASPQEVMRRVCPGLNPDNELNSEDMKILNKVINGSGVIADQFLNQPVAYRKMNLDLVTGKYNLTETRSFFKTPENLLYILTDNNIGKDKTMPVIIEKIQLDEQNRPVSVHQTFQKGEFINEETLQYDKAGSLISHVNETTGFSEVHTIDQRSEQNFTITVEDNLLKSITEEKTVEKNGDKEHSVNQFTFRYKAKVDVQKSVVYADNFYPNPTLGPVKLDLQNEVIDHQSVSLYDLSGNTINTACPEIKAGQIEIDLRQLPAGIYLVSYETDLQKYVSKIVKN